MSSPWYKNPERMATVFAIGSIVVGIVAIAIWSPLSYVFFPGSILFHAFDWWFSGAMGLPPAANMTDAQSDLTFYIYGPVMLISFVLSIGAWAGIGYWIGKSFARRTSQR
jgi:hypothetical protein